jgi:hypothetical protein
MTGALVAFPINWWMVAHHLKHGMMTVRAAADAGAEDGMKMDMGEGGPDRAPRPPVWVMTVLSLVVLAIGATIAFTFGSGH